MASNLADIEASQTKLEARFRNSRSIGLLDAAIANLEERCTRIDEDPVSSDDLAALLQKLQKDIAEDQKETYNAQMRHGKAIAKRFNKDITAACDPEVFAGKQDLINKAIATHFICDGEFKIAETFAREANVELDPELIEEFRTMYGIAEALDRGELGDAISWTSNHRDDLTNSTLEFDLRKSEFLRIFNTRHIFEAIQYAQTYFPVFAGRHLKEIKQLMAAVTYHKNIKASPYAHIFADADTRQALKDAFIADFTARLKMSPISPLHTTFEAANYALPTLLKLSSLKLNTTKGTTGVDIPLPAKYRFHSVFVCPVTKEVGGDAFMLGCGHVIGGEALQSLCKGTQKLKCPYCPVISDVNESVKLIF